MMSLIIRLTLVISILATAIGAGSETLAQTNKDGQIKAHKPSADDIPYSLQPPLSKAEREEKEKKAKAAANKPSLFERMIQTGDEQMAKKEYSQARATFRELCWRRPLDPVPMLKEAGAAAKCGDLDDAMVWAKKACTYAPNYGEAHIQLGHILESNRDWKAAYYQYARALDLAHDAEKKIALETPMLRALINVPDYEKADALTLSMIKQNKKSADCYYNRAWFLCASKKEDGLADAIENYRQTLILAPDRNDARFNLALLLVKNHETDAAAIELKKFIEAADNDPDKPRAEELLKKLESK